MSITVTEKITSRPATTGDTQSLELLYVIGGAPDEAAAQEALLATAPQVYGGLVRRNASVKPVGDGSSWWDGTVEYGVARHLRFRKTGEKVLSFEMGGATTHVTQSIQTMSAYVAPEKTAEDFKGAVGVSGAAGEEHVEGVDLAGGQFNFTITYYMPASEVTEDWLGKLYRLSSPPRANDKAWSVTCTTPPVTLYFAEQEVLFLGASGGPRSDDDYEMAFRFGASPNTKDGVVGDITGIEKRGWEYLWVRYETAKGAKTLVKRPAQVNVEQVYYVGDFSVLGL